MNQIHPEEFPREKLIKYGVENLTNYELLAILLNTGTKNENVIELSKRITKKYELNHLSSISISQITKELGIGIAKACKILACFELGKRSFNKINENKLKINCPESLANLYFPKTSNLNQENLFAVYLNTRKKIISEKRLFVGSLNESIINPREIFKNAFEEGASGIILIHNHPSGESSPSQSDIDVTRELIKISEIMQIPILDHIIIGKNNYTSLKEERII